MADRDDSGWGELDAERLETLDPDDFEKFCADLINFEATGRHDGPHIDWPAGRAVPDGGRDVLLTIGKKPLTSKTEYQKQYRLSPLTEDLRERHVQTRTAYSCKSGENWLDLALRDADDPARAARAVEVLLEGGYFKLLINVDGKLDNRGKRGTKGTPLERLVAAFWARLQKESPGAEDPGPRIEIVDAGTIASFLRALHPSGGSFERWVKKLEVLPILRGLQGWRDWHGAERSEPAFSYDAERSRIRDELTTFLRQPQTKADRAAVLVGPPGIGKTRLVLEALSRDPAVEQWVVVALSYEEALEALDARRLLARRPSAVLVVDDCSRDDAGRLASFFAQSAAQRENARLIVLVPASGGEREKVRLKHGWSLGALDDDARRALAANELGTTDDTAAVEEIARLSEGYPWFATLIAREARDQGRAPHDLQEAMRWALASRWEKTTEPDHEELRRRRARCLLAATLTRRIDWDDLSEGKRADLARAVGLDRWAQIQDGAVECVKRGILRRNLGWHFKYITPLVLEREVLTWLLGPDGTDPGGRTLARHAQDYLDDFFETLDLLGLSATILVAIAEIGLADLVAADPDWGALRAAGLLGARLLFLARHRPEATAREIRCRVEGASLDDLGALAAQRPDLVFVLEELSSRLGSFEDAEAALFRLAQAWWSRADHALTKWASLFLVGLNATHRGLEQRMNLLEHRLSDPDALARNVALAGIERLLASSASRRALARIDGSWPAPTREEAALARQRAWRLLALRFADAESEIAARARKLAIENIRGAVRAGMGEHAMATIADNLPAFSDAERVRLREKLDEVRSYDATWLDPAGQYPQRLEDLLTPTTFRERLHRQVGVWGPAALREDDDARDDVVAREGLAGEQAPLLGELDWLVSNEARRSHVFADALGRNDERGVLLAGLRERARAWRTSWKARIVFAQYLGAWALAGKREEVDTVLRDMQTSPEEAPQLALAIIVVGATAERVAWMESALRADRIDPAAVTELGRRRDWLSGVGDDAFASLVGVLVDGAPLEHPATALEMIVDRLKDHPAGMLPLRPLLLRALSRLAPLDVNGMTGHYWELGAAVLLAQGETARVAELALVVLARPQGSDDHAWTTLHRAAERDVGAVWQALSAALDRRDVDTEHLLMTFCYHRASFSWPLKTVLDWVGDDERRARAVVSLVRPYLPELDLILRALVQRFGARSVIAGEIVARIHTAGGATSSLAEHDAEQLKHARRWLSDPDPEIRAFARRLVESLERSHERHAAYEDDERRRYGT